MNRVKTFDSSGVAPPGVLFSGDLNAIQDAAAGLTDLAQTLSVGALAIGESGLQLLHFGTGEARLSGAFRTDGILRALGGLYAGAFTTAQRNAIAVGFRPYGLLILNTDNNEYEMNFGTDATPNWLPIWNGAIAAPSGPGTNTVLVYNGTSWVAITLANAQIAANAAIAVSKLAAGTNGQTLQTVAGVPTWATSAASGPAWTIATTPPGSPAAGDHWILPADDTNGVDWHFVYNPAETTYKWRFIGGASLFGEVLTQQNPASAGSYVDLATAGPSITLPRAGDYEISMFAAANDTGGGLQKIAPKLGAAATSDNDASIRQATTSNGWTGQLARTIVRTGLAASAVIKLQYQASSSTSNSFFNRNLSIRPIRVI